MMRPGGSPGLDDSAAVDELTVADALVVTLRDWGLGYLFGVSGANIEHLHDAVHRLGDGRLQSIMAKSEVGASFMADGRARTHRTLGLCCATSGGGMMNLMVGLAESRADGVPVLAIIGQTPTKLEGRGGFQDASERSGGVDALAMCAAVAKYAAKVDNPDDLWVTLREAVEAALSGRRGPSILLIPRDIFAARVGPAPVGFPTSLMRPTVDIQDGDPRDSAIRSLFEAIRRAEDPVLLVGPGVTASSCPEAVINFARRANLRVITTLSSKGAYPNDADNYLGMVGVAGEPSAHDFLSRRADLLVVAGSPLDIMTRTSWEPALKRLAYNGICAIDTDLAMARRVVELSVAIEGDIGSVFSRLLHLLDTAPFVAPALGPFERMFFAPSLSPALQAQTTGEATVPDSGAKANDDPRHRPLLQSEAIALIDAYLPTSGHVLFDAGNCSATALHMIQVPPGVSATIALGMGGMGYAIGAAVGAQLGSAEGATSLVFCGDGAFLMGGFEIHTAVDLGLPILFVVFNNNMHGMCVTRQQQLFAGRIEASRYAPVDVAQVARGFGPPERLWVGSAGTLSELEAALSAYQGVGDRPGVLELRLTIEEVPPFKPFLEGDAPTISKRRPNIAGS